MWGRVTVKTAPASLPVTTAEAKTLCDITFDTDDALIDGLIKTAVSKFDGPTGIGIALITQTWELSLDSFPTGDLELLGWPVKSVSSVSYIDANGDTQTMPEADYRLDAKGDKARLSPAHGKSWPSSRGENGAVSIEYVVGEAASNINPVLTLALKQLVGHWYENRESSIDKNLYSVPHSTEQVMLDFRRGTISS